jgi:hypothetical protein
MRNSTSTVFEHHDASPQANGQQYVGSINRNSFGRESTVSNDDQDHLISPQRFTSMVSFSPTCYTN